MVDRQEPYFDRPEDDALAAPAPRAAPPPAAPHHAPADIPTLNDVAAPPPVPVGDDPLLHALVWFTAHHGRPRSAHALASSLSLEGPMEPHQAIRALREHGFRAGLIQRPIGVIHDMLLPAILLLQHGDACILAERLPKDSQHGERYQVIMPGPSPQACVATEAELAPEYSGFAIAAAPEVEAAPTPIAPEERGLRDPESHWLWGTLRRFMPYYRAGLVAALLSNVLMIAIGLVTSVVFDRVIPHQAMVTLWALAAGAAVAQVFDFAARQLRAHLIDLAGKKADMIIGTLLFKQTLNVRLEHRPDSAGSYAHVLAQIEVVRDFFASASLSALSDLPFIVLFIAMAFLIGGPLGWVLVGAIPVIVGTALLIQGRLKRAMSSGMARQADLQGLLVEAVEGLEDLKANGAQGRFLQRYEDATAMAAESALRSRSLSSMANNITAAAQQLITLVMLVWGVYLIKDGVVTGGALIGAVMFAGRAVGPLGSVVSLANRYQGARAAMLALDRLMNQPTERVPGRHYVANHKVEGRIGLQDVSFAYPASGDNPPPKVLKEVTLRFAPGERVAILGRIGSGKSTVLRLLAGLYQPTEGMVDVDGIDLRQIDPADFRVRVGFVSQEPRLFNGTLRENVLLGRASADASHLPEVAKLTGLDRVAAQHPLGWDQPVGEMGGRLSGGQRQLVALARCLITRPQILLMDEPTSSMDAQSETMFLKQLKAAVGKRTMVLITHRPAALDLVERIVVIDGGKVLIDGPKAQVLAALSGAPVPPAGAQAHRPAPAAAAAPRGVAA